MKKKFLWILSAGHMFTDMNQGALPAILPFLIVAGGLSYSGAAGLTFAIALSSSVIQPLFGIWADKMSKPWLMPVGILMAGGCLSLIGFFPRHYSVMFTAAIFSGIGIAAFHPEAARIANHMAGSKKGGGMSIFSVGGNVGFAIGPALATAAILRFGLPGSVFLAVPAVTMCVILALQSGKMQNQIDMGLKENPAAAKEIKNEWGKFSWLTLAVVARSIVFHSLNTFLPLYWLKVLHQSEAAAGATLTIMFAAGAVSTLIGGHLADRLGANTIVKIGWILLIPLLFLFPKVENPFFATLLLLPIAFGIFTVTTPMIVLGQKYLPGKLGFASGVTLGLGVSIGGIAAPFVGKYADIHGLSAAFGLIAFIPIAGALVALTLRPPEKDR
ncbi:MAG: MFS transporter [Spirochaetales bacterium]|jgi:FSR family fosmidomycin resistance protein-like MFS transporter|nr:MFS transporter [Spirochaetales bacterium]